MTDGALIRTEAADASNSGLAVSFETDVRAEVYVCCDSRYPAPSWLSSWVATDMTVPVTDGMVGGYKVYAKRFDAGTVQLSANQAGEMYFVVAKESLPKLPRNGWVLLTYDMPYLREIIKAAAQSQTVIQVTWEASSDNVGVTGYKVFRDGTEVTTSAFTSYTDSGLAAGTTYSYTVSACDGAGNDSGQSSPPAVATTFSKVDIDIAAAKQQGDGTLVTVSGKVVTAIFATCLYIEEPDKFSGIRVVPLEMPADIEVNEVVNVSGTIRTEMGQRYIDGASVTSTVGGN